MVGSGTARLAEHGGRLCEARALYPQAPEPWIDLSTGINPHPYPAPRASETARARLPTPEEIRALEAAAARAFGVESADRIVATAGSEEALRLLPYVLRTESALIVGPTYSSHAAAWRSADVWVTELNGSANPRVSGFEDVLPPGAALTLVNPNNPDGVVTSRERLDDIHAALVARDGHLIVDEAFADVEPDLSVAAGAGTEWWKRLIVLRSFGKFFGLAGVRLGFVIAAPGIVARFRELLGDWRVSADAIAAGLAAYADDSWATRTREQLHRSAQRLDDVLRSADFEIVGGTILYRLVRGRHARACFERLLHAGILARPFDHDPTLLRFGLPGNPAAWSRLADALRTP
jgi:cobalamin biosynthetic protein CobC